MKFLLIDIGNTTAHFKVFDNDKKELNELIRISSKNKNNAKNICDSIKPYMSDVDEIIYSNVVVAWKSTIQDISTYFNIPNICIKKDIELNSDDFLIDDIQILGADFVANYYAVKKREKKNYLIVSLGTATTILKIKNLKVSGVTISPGLISAIDGLTSNAPALKKSDFKWTEKTIGSNSFDAISIGSIKGHYYMIKSLLNDLNDLNDYEIIFTGGNAIYFENQIKDDSYILDYDLIFKGLLYLKKIYIK